MKRGRSTGNPTKAEANRIVDSKIGPCIPCMSWARQGKMSWADIAEGGDYDHVKSGNIRRGHLEGYCSCGWHHRRLVPDGWTHKAMTNHFGPSKLDGGKTYAAAYGSEDELIQMQTTMNNQGYL